MKAIIISRNKKTHQIKLGEIFYKNLEYKIGLNEEQHLFGKIENKNHTAHN